MPDDVFVMKLARTNFDSLGSWEYLMDLDPHASQPTVHVNDNGSILIAYERTGTPYGNYIRLRYYKSFEDLLINKFYSQVDLERQLSPSAEGTPSFESVIIDNHDLDNSVIKLRFHFFDNYIADRQARGILQGFFEWKVEILTRVNRNLVDMGYNGNLGSRSKF